MGGLIAVEEKETHAVIRLDRPEKKNAMNRAARRELLGTLAALQGHRAIVLTGTGDSFCAGVDLKESRADAEAGTPPEPASDWIEVNLAIRRHPAIFIAAVNGLALGGGATLVSVCDLALAATEAEIGMPEIGFAAYPQFSGPGAQIQLTAKRAAWLVLTAERIDGATAEAWGMVNRAVPRARLMAEAEALAARLGRFDPAALTESKRALEAIPQQISDWRTAFEYGIAANRRIREAGQAQQEGFARFAAGQRNPGQGRTQT
jgi:enoyl-CoA hydratase/carnithine racemase